MFKLNRIFAAECWDADYTGISNFHCLLFLSSPHASTNWKKPRQLWTETAHEAATLHFFKNWTVSAAAAAERFSGLEARDNGPTLLVRMWTKTMTVSNAHGTASICKDRWYLNSHKHIYDAPRFRRVEPLGTTLIRPPSNTIWTDSWVNSSAELAGLPAPICFTTKAINTAEKTFACRRMETRYRYVNELHVCDSP